jgi:hypothetical protein
LSVKALAILVCGSNIWTLRQNDKKLLTSIKMKWFGRSAAYPLFDQKRNKLILEMFTVDPVDEKLRKYNQIGHDM